MNASRLACGLLGLLLLAGLSGCGLWHRPTVADRKPTSYAETGSLHTAVVSVVPFDALSRKLAPNFALDPDDALLKALAVTSSSQSLSDQGTQLMLQLALGGTTRSGSSSETTTTANGVTTSTATNEVKTATAPGNAASIPKASIPQAGASSAPPVAPADGHNAILRYQLATALLQEVALLNAYVQDAPRRHGYDPFIVRLQVAVRPRARYTPFDAEVDVAFECPVAMCGNDAPLVVPLLVNDTIDASSVSSLQRNLTQLGLAIGSMRGTFGFLGEWGARAEDVVSGLGWQYQNVLSVARKNDHALTVRMGAMPTGYSKFEMMTRTYNVTALLLVKRPVVGTPCEAREQRPCLNIDYSATSRFTHAQEGTRFPAAAGDEGGVDRGRFQINFWPRPSLPPTGQSASVYVEGDKEPFRAALKLRGGAHLTERTFKAGHLCIDCAVGRPGQLLIAERVDVSANTERSTLELQFDGLSLEQVHALDRASVAIRLFTGPDAADTGSTHDLQVQTKTFNAPAQVPKARLKVGPELVVDAKGDGVLRLVVDIPSTATDVASVAVSFKGGIAGDGLAFNGNHRDCATLKADLLIVTTACNVDVPLRNLTTSASLDGKPSSLEVTFVERRVNGVKISGGDAQKVTLTPERKRAAGVPRVLLAAPVR